MIAQAAATMAAMYPGRFWLGLGSGEALNEHVVAEYWPEVPERIARMFESIEIIRKLFTGKDVKHKGQHYRMETMRLWTMPETPDSAIRDVTLRGGGRVYDDAVPGGAGQ